MIFDPETCVAFQVTVRHETQGEPANSLQKFVVVVRKVYAEAVHHEMLEKKDVAIGSNRKLKDKAYVETAVAEVSRHFSVNSPASIVSETEAREISNWESELEPDVEESERFAIWRL